MANDQNMSEVLAALATQQRSFTPDFVKTIHRKAYAAIDPTRPALSAAGKTIIIPGGATGIGYEIARSFAFARATTIIIAGRRIEVVEKAATSLSAEFPETQILHHGADIVNPDSVKQLFDYAIKEAKTGSVDVLVTAAVFPQPTAAALDIPINELKSSFETNVIGNLNIVRNFLAAPSSTGKIILDVTSEAITNCIPGTAAYASSKGAFTFFMRHIQAEHPEVRVHSFHPGVVWTDLVVNAKVPRDMIAAMEDHVDLPGHFAVWLASPEAEFLKGKTVWSKWDVEDLKKNKEIFEKDPTYLTIRLVF